jgi:glutathione synthase
MRIAIFADPVEQFNIYKDTTYAIMHEAFSRQHELYVFTQSDLFCEQGRVFASMRRIYLEDKMITNHWYRLDASETLQLNSLDVVLMRKDPPFNMEYVYATYLLEQAKREGAQIWNSPRAIRDHSEKCAILEFPELTQTTLVTSNINKLKHFLTVHQQCVIKPLDGMGGSSIFRLFANDINQNVIFETLTQYGQQTVMIQRFIPEIREGDKRILLIAGQVVPYALARIPAEGESRGNLAAGGKGVAQKLTIQDRAIAEKLAPILWKRGLFLVGLDVIGNYLTEINVTSPTCFQEIFNQTGFNVASLFVDQLEHLYS